MAGCDLVVVGGSWGGLDAVGQLLGPLPQDWPVPIAVVLHRGHTGREDMLTRAVQRRTSLRVVEADDKAPLEPGTVFIAPADYHLLIEDAHLALSVDLPVRFSRPSIDVLFESAADSFGDRLVAVLLTGANDDGTRGCAAVKRLGGRTYAQDPATAERAEMPAAAIAAGTIDKALALCDLAEELMSLVAFR